MSGHSLSMRPATALDVGSLPATEAPPEDRPTAATPPPEFAEIYEVHFDFIWRSARRLGVPSANVDDVVQDVFLTAHRRLDSFEGRSNVKTWLFGIAIRVVRDHRRSRRRKPTQPLPSGELADQSGNDPQRAAEHNEALGVLHELLDKLSDDKREVFVLTELEQLSAPEIAEMLGMNVNTVYARVRAARADFEKLVSRRKAGLRPLDRESTP